MREKNKQKKGSFTYALIQVVGLGKMEEAGHLMWLVWKHIWLSMVGPKLEVEAINRGTSHHWPSSGCSELTAAEAVAWLPGWLLQRCGSEVYCHLWCIHCPQVHQVPQFPLLAILLLDRNWPIRDTGDPGLRYSRIVQLSHRKLYHEIFWVLLCHLMRQQLCRGTEPSSVLSKAM